MMKWKGLSVKLMDIKKNDDVEACSATRDLGEGSEQ